MKKTKRVWENRIVCLLMATFMAVLTIAGTNRMPVYAAEETETQAGENHNEASITMEEAKPVNLNQAGYDIIYVIDNSLSIVEAGNETGIRNQALKNITNLAYGSNNRIGAVYFADHVADTKNAKLGLQDMKEPEESEKSDKSGFETVLDFLVRTKENNEEDNDDIENKATNIGAGLNAAIDLFKDKDNTREKIIILFSDGVNRNVEKEDEDYRTIANKDTFDAVKELEKNEIKLYCVFLEKSADESDEEYLKQLVNYFSEENDYAEERFNKVPMHDISSLSETFADVFYKMQNNMKYIQIRKDNLDTEGSKGFYIPSVGATRLDIYLDGDVGSRTRIKPAGECDYKKWSEGSAAFCTFINPAAGDWTITIDGDIPDDFFGTVACYANLSAKISLEDTGKAATYKAIADFYNEKGEKVNVDSGMEVAFDYVLLDENDDGEYEATPVAMSIQNGKAISDEFKLQQLGDYRFDLKMIYKDSMKDFVDLSYEMSYRLENRSPMGFDQIGKEFAWKRISDGGLQAAIDENELFIDPEGGKVTITEVAQLNPENSVQVDQNAGYIYLTAQKAGDISVSISAVDEEGASSSVLIEGKARDPLMEKVKLIVKLIFTGIVIAVIIALIISWRRRYNRRKEEERRKRIEERKKLEESRKAYDDLQSKYDTDAEKFENAASRCEKFEKELTEKKAEIERIIKNLKMVEKDYNLNEDQMKIYDVYEYAQDDYVPGLFAEQERIHNEISELCKKYIEINKQRKKENPGGTNNYEELKAAMSKHSSDVSEYLQSLNEKETELINERDKIFAVEKKLGECNIDVLLENEIGFDVIVTNIAGEEGVGSGQAIMSKYASIKKDMRTGCYSLGDIITDPENELKLGDLCERSKNVYVSGFSDEESGRKGVVLKSTQTFQHYADGKPLNTKELYVYKGRAEKIKLDDTQMTVKIM